MEHLSNKITKTLDVVKEVIYGQDELLNGIFSALICEGHVLIEGLPGLGKTLSVSTMSKICDLSFNRIQFTPDLLPSDLIGTMIYLQKKEEFSVKFGPVFTQLLLADEINRSPAKVQSALLEAMAEKQVTIGEKSYKLDRPFVVLATQNPIEQEGTYELPEAQLDRFMIKVNVNYPDLDSEKKILKLEESNFDALEPILNLKIIDEIKKGVNSVYVDEKVQDFIVKFVHATRPGSEYFFKQFDNIIEIGASPRASVWLFKLSKYYAFLDKRDYVVPEDILKVAPLVLSHRVSLSYEAVIDQIVSKEIIIDIGRKLL